MERETEKFCCSDLTAIVVGNKRQTLTLEATAYFNRLNIPYEVCEDIYSAVAAMVTAPAGTNLLIVGCFATLTAENMQFFSLAPKDKKVFFCCMIRKWFEPLQARLLEAARAGVFLVNSAEQIDGVIKRCIGTDAAVAAARQKADSRDFAARIASLADNFFLTDAEQDALLGVEYNADTKNRALTE